MTKQPSAGDPYFPATKPQPLVFNPISDDGVAATFEAPVPGREAPGSPVLALAVTVASSVLRDSGKEFNELLGQMKATFDVLPELPPGFEVSGDVESSDPGDGGESSDPGDGGESFDLEEQMRIMLRLVSFDGARPAAFVVTVETTAGTLPAPGKTGQLRAYTVTPRLDDYWYATISPPPTAHVHITGGQGTMRRPKGHPNNVHTPPPNDYPLPNAKEFILHASGQTMGYTVNSGFYSPQHP